MLTPAILKAARALAGLSVQDLADHAQVAMITLKRVESGVRASAITQERLEAGLTKAGVTVILNGSDGMGPGVRLTQSIDVPK